MFTFLCAALSLAFHPLHGFAIEESSLNNNINNVSNFSSTTTHLLDTNAAFSLFDNLDLLLSNTPKIKRSASSSSWPAGQWSSKEHWDTLKVHGRPRRIKVIVDKRPEGLGVKVYFAKRNQDSNLYNVLWTNALPYSRVPMEGSGSVHDSIDTLSQYLDLGERDENGFFANIIIFGATLTSIVTSDGNNRAKATINVKVAVRSCSLVDTWLCNTISQNEMSTYEHFDWQFTDYWPLE